MKKENLIWLAVGGLAVYFLFLKKTAKAEPLTESPKSTTKPLENLTESQLKAATMRDEDLLSYHQKFLCYGMRGVNEPSIGMTLEKAQMNYAVESEINKRKLTIPKCLPLITQKPYPLPKG